MTYASPRGLRNQSVVARKQQPVLSRILAVSPALGEARIVAQPVAAHTRVGRIHALGMLARPLTDLAGPFGAYAIELCPAMVAANSTRARGTGAAGSVLTE